MGEAVSAGPTDWRKSLLAVNDGAKPGASHPAASPGQRHPRIRATDGLCPQTVTNRDICG